MVTKLIGGQIPIQDKALTGFEIAKQSGYWKLKHYRMPHVADQQETAIDYDLEEN